MADINTIFCRKLLSLVHADARKAFPQIKNVVQACGVTTWRRGQWCAEIDVPGRQRFFWEGRAESATEARANAWRALLRTLEPVDA